MPSLAMPAIVNGVAFPGERPGVTQFGGSSLDVVFGRRGLRPRLLILLLASVFLVSCGVDLSGGNWPGLTAEGDIVYVANGPSVRAFDVRQQQLLWSWPEESGTQFYAPPALRADLMAVGDFGASGGFLSPSVVVTVYMLDKPGSRQPQSRWTDMEGADDRIIAGPVLTDDQVFFVTADNVVLAYTAETGGLEWKVSLGQGQGIWGTPTYGDGVLYVASLDHAVYALDASDGSQRWRSQLNGATVGQPTLGESLLYVGNFDGRVHALSLDTGAQAWETEAGDWIWGSPTLVDNVL